MTKNDNACQVKKYLESYGVNKKMLHMMKYADEYFGSELRDDSLPTSCGDETFIKAKMYDVRRFVMNMEDGNAKLMLFYHYIKGLSVEKCAEMMNISRTGGFRLRKRALALAEEKYLSMKKNTAFHPAA